MRAPSGWQFWAGLAAGIPVMAFGVGWVLGHPGRGKPVELAKWVVGADLLHDAVLAPVACLVGVLVVARLPGTVRAPVRAGLFTSAIVFAVGYPALRGFGRNPTNPTELPLDYATAVATALGVVWVLVGLWWAVAVWTTRRSTRSVALAVIAKAPRPGSSKTRLCPPCTPDEAAGVAQAALEDTLSVMATAPVAGSRAAVLEGEPGSWLPDDFAVVPQGAGDLGDRLAGAFAALDGPAVVIAMDTPQVTGELLGSAVEALGRPGTDAVLGLTDDGGYWAIGLRRPDRRVFEGVPMSSPDTGAAQLERLHDLGLATALLPRLRDVDTFADAIAVAAEAPRSRFATAVERVAARTGTRKRSGRA
ncbi:MAG TPA: TIGR04282 family arsenosugar biosynthesis glycosyltransferase [Acidimicrobiia bacterium]